MKEFIKMAFATVVGFLISGFCLMILGIMFLAALVASTENTTTTVKDRSVFVLELNGNVAERYQTSPLDKLLGEDFSTYGLDQILSSIRKAKENESIAGIYIEAGNFVCPTASLQEIRRALLDFKESGKFIVAYGGNYTQSTYYLASVADNLAVNPSGSIAWQGLSAQTVFLKGLLEKIGVEMQIFRVGTYKSAVEPFIAHEMSDANRKQTEVFIGSIWNNLVNDISASRHITSEELNALADKNLSFCPAQEYIQTKLADKLMYKDEVLSYLKTLTGRTEKEELPTLRLEDMINVPETASKSNLHKDRIAIYYAFGEIDNRSNTYDEGINSEVVINDLRRLREDDKIKAVVFRVNSPGGSAYGSEQIWREISLLKEVKPVVVSMGDYAASGGYYISCAANYIYAEPTTITGSIGIFGMIPNAQKLLEDKLGLSFDGVKTNKLADLGDFSRPFNQEESALVQQMVNQGYALFTQRCADGRRMPIEKIQEIAEGRVWTGEDAKKLNLVDELGGINQAVEKAASLAELTEYSIQSYPAQEDKWFRLLDLKSDHYIQSQIRSAFGDFYPGVRFMQQIKHADRIQARLPFELSIN